MTVFNGKSVYGAIVSGCVCVLKKPALRAEKRTIEDTAEEIRRFGKAKETAGSQLQELYDMYIDQIGEPNAQIFNIHMMMLDDEDYCDSITGMITDGHVNAEYAVEQTSEVFAKMLESMDNEYMRARSADIRDVCQRLISNLSGIPRDFGDIPENAVVCADDITPTEAALLEQRNIAAFVTAFGSPISHTAILAHSMDIPAVIGTGSDLLARAKDGDEAIVDGFAGQVILSPDPDAKSRLDAKRRARTSTAADQETRTLDGKRVTLLACDTTQIPEYADGVAVLDCREIENEEQQYEFYRSIAEIADYSKAVIRLAAISPYDPRRHEKYQMQIRAALRASSHGSPSILFPMITTVTEARKILGACDEIRNELTAEGLDCSEDSRLGFMIETPAAAIISDLLAPMADTLMIDSDRLARLTLARSEGSVFSEEFAEGQRAAVLRLIEYCARNAVKNGARIGICGSLAADTSLTEEFLRMGIDKICAPSYLLEDIRSAVMNTDLSAGC